MAKLFWLLLAITAQVCLSFSLQDITNPLSEEYITYLQSIETTWKAGRNFHKDTPLKYLKKLLGSRNEETYQNIAILTDEDLPYFDEPLPESFDARNKWTTCPSISTISDQGPCGSCWAISVADVLTDRTCIVNNGAQSMQYSTEDILTCCSTCGDGCDGGYPAEAFHYWKHNGVVSGGNYSSQIGCVPYVMQPCEHHVDSDSRPNCTIFPDYTPVCQKECEESYDVQYKRDKHTGKDIYKIYNLDSVKKDIIANGPVQASFDVYSDFVSYKSGVYQKSESAQYLGGHAIRIIGYGVDDDVPYWLVANSWNTDWGDKGLFKILRGQNMCQIESYIYAGTPHSSS